jgi:alpha-amylase/alpha-mannosidase (GH57 family)
VTAPLRSVVIHGHFYQPPREDPWLDEVEAEPSAAPFHDWNERIERECYRAVVAARLYAPDGRIARIINTLASISFNFGPTLLEWMERHAPRTYASILEADRISSARHSGHGNAIAMPYHHAILPLASRRDKVTEVRWGIADFRHRFGREPAGMWLPETAVDPETLDVLAAEGIQFTILAPHQMERAPATGLPGWYRTPGGRTIALFAYDGPISHDVAFGGLSRNAQVWAERLLTAGSGGRQLVTVATDGETYGHHHHFGEMALSWLLNDLALRDVLVENFSSFLARHPPQQEVRLVAPTSWSCPHGVERWRADCGCRMAPERLTNQRWRSPLREGLDWLAGELHSVFQREGAQLLGDPWTRRDAYGSVVAGDGSAIDRWLDEGAFYLDDPDDRVRAKELLELERNALRMFTSCGWFFDDIAGIETLQVLRYAARAIELAGASAPRLEAGLLDRLALAESNDPAVGNGRDLYMNAVKPRVPAPLRVAAGYAALRCVAPRAASATTGCYAVEGEGDRLHLTHCRTGREYAARVSVERRGTARLVIDATSADTPAPTRLALADLPERQRLAVTGAIRREIIARRFTPDEAAELATGADVLLPHVAARALLRAVTALEHDQSAAAIGVVSDLVDLLDLENQHIPFDVQTEFYRIRPQVPRDLARRLGFAEGD